MERPYSNKAVDDSVFGRVWRKDTEGAIAVSHDLSDKYCQKLFNFIEFTADGSCWMCCPAWLPYRIGNILTQDFETEIWNGKQAKLLRSQVFTGNWKYCDSILCPVIASNSLPKLSDIDNDHSIDSVTRDNIKNNQLDVALPTRISFSEDESCNLQCPSCRLRKIMYAEDSLEFQQRKKLNQKIVDVFLSKPSMRPLEIIVTGSGDPFASKIYREMLQNLDGEILPNLKVTLMTNGVMFTEKMWNRLYKIHNNIGHIRISLDAGTKHTYENITRIGGDWDQLLTNIVFLNAQSKLHKNVKLNFDFVVQSENYREIPAFAELISNICDNHKSIHLSMVADWGTWNKEEFANKTIWNQSHPEFENFLQVLRHPALKTKNVYFGNITPLYKVANNIN